MARVYVTGCGGSGKTTLSTLLGARLECPVVHLDDAYAFFWRSALPHAERCARAEATIRELAARESWVIEGNFPGWIDEFAARADVVVWLDVPFRVAAWRIVRRHVLAELRGDNAHPGYWNLCQFLVSTRRYCADTGQAYRARLAQDPGRWSGAGYGRAAIAAQIASAGDRVLRVTGGRPQQIAAGVVACLRSQAPPATLCARRRRGLLSERCSHHSGESAPVLEA